MHRAKRIQTITWRFTFYSVILMMSVVQSVLAYLFSNYQYALFPDLLVLGACIGLGSLFFYHLFSHSLRFIIVHYARIIDTRLRRVVWSWAAIFISFLLMMFSVAIFFSFHPNIDWNHLPLRWSVPFMMLFALVLVSGWELVVTYQGFDDQPSSASTST